MFFNIIYHFYDSEDFVQVFNHKCLAEGNELYYTLDEALLNCASDTRCVGIMDGSCDNVNEFKVCLVGIKNDDGEYSGCVYKKVENHGEYIKTLET